MKNKYKLVVFDLDGTILDTAEGILASVEYVVEKFGLPKLEKEILPSFIGPPIQDSFSKYYGLTENMLKAATTAFRDNYSSKTLLLAKPYDGIYKLFDYLSSRGIKIAVATYKREDYALKLLHHFG